METVTAANQQLGMMAGLQIGQPLERDPGRPSMILRRAGTDSLWDLAKRYGSTVEAICNANDLEDQAEQGRMLLIPVS
jgi:hypothetical protein